MELCLVKGKSTDDCNNYIRVLAKVDSDQLLVCGTNAYNPRCRNYARNNESVYEVIREFSGKGYCPYDPTNNSTAIYAGKKWARRRDLAFYCWPPCWFHGCEGTLLSLFNVFLLKFYSSHGREKFDKHWIILDGELYSGTVSDFSGSDALIIKNQIRTGQYNLKELNGEIVDPKPLNLHILLLHFTGPDFVSSIEDKDFVYFFFREEAVEYMNCGKVS